ncbi:TonB-dependent receptor [Aurantiacibacter rhizosphaerae]|nr:TonB-dependent receptor [Aurantiacibacter rhizosphaerae]
MFTQMPKPKLAALLASTASVAMLATPALAQDTAPEDEPATAPARTNSLDTIVVTAQKRQQSANDVGITLSAFSGDSLVDRGVQDAGDLALITPGLTVSDTGPTGLPVYTLRGVGFQDYSTAAASTVGLYFDGISVPYTVMSRGAVFDLQRVEVLKGPQGDLYGRNTTAGQINYISNQPTETLDANISLGLSSFETLDVNGHVSGAIADGVRGRLAFTTTQSGKGWQKSLTRDGDTLGRQNVYAVRGLLSIDVGEGQLDLKAQYLRDQSENKANTTYNGTLVGDEEFALPYVQLFPYLVAGEDPPWYSTGDNQAADWSTTWTDGLGVTRNVTPRRDNELINLAAQFEYPLSDDISITSLTGYDKFDRVEYGDADGAPSVDSNTYQESAIEVFSQELRLNGEFGRLNWVAGLYYSWDSVDEYYKLIMPDSFYGNAAFVFGAVDAPFYNTPVLALDTDYYQETTSKAAFVHLEYEVLDGLRLIGGLRYTDEKRTWTGCTDDTGDGSLAAFINGQFGATLSAGDCATIDDIPTSDTYIFDLLGTPDVNQAFHDYTQTIRMKRWMYKLGMDYRITPDVLTYATFSHGVKSGGFNGAASNTTSQLEAYEPETLDSYEVGLKSTLLNDSMQLNLSAFYYDYRNKQEPGLAVSFVGNISGIDNVPKSEIIGAEIDMQWSPTYGLNLFLGATYLHTEIKEWDAVSNASVWPNVVTFDASGLPLAQAPQWQLNGGVDYNFEVSNSLLLGFGFDANYKDDTSGNVARGVYADTEAYTVVNARLYLGDIDEAWKVTLWSKNLFDEYYYPAALYAGNGPYVRSVGKPRTVGVTASFDF